VRSKLIEHAIKLSGEYSATGGLGGKPILSRDVCNPKNLLDELHIYIFAMMGIGEDDY
jgi:hypothetical protein